MIVIVIEDDEISPGPEHIVNSLRIDRCPDCAHFPMTPGLRKGSVQNLSCEVCSSSWVVAPVRFITLAKRIKP